MMATASIIVNIVLNFLPAHGLRLYPFMDRLRVKKVTLAIIYALFFVLQASVFLLFKNNIDVDFRRIQFYKAAFGLVGFALPFLLVKERLSKILFIYLLVAVYTTTMIRTTNHIEMRYFEGLLRETVFSTNNLIMLMLTALTLPPMLLFIGRAMKPALRSVGYTEIWRCIWVIPALFYALLVVDSIGSGFSLEHIAGTTFFLMSFLSAGGMLTACYVLLKTLRQTAENAALKENARMTEQQLILQGDQYKMLTENIEQTQAARHNLRHQLAVMNGYLMSADLSGALKYCDELTKSIPVSAGKAFCDNFAVNAVAAHYLAKAEGIGIETDVRAVIPAKAGQVRDSDLCVIVGNLLENAVEACERVEDGEKTIKLRAHIRYDNLTITVDNCFDGAYTEKDGVFFSRKREGGGIGLSSVRAAAEKYGGALECEAEGRLFMASVYVKMGETENAPCGRRVSSRY